MEQLKALVMAALEQSNGTLSVDYVSFANPSNLEEYPDAIGDNGAILSTAVRLGKTRLIENILLGCNL